MKYIKTQDLLNKKVLSYQEILNLKKRLNGYSKSRENRLKDKIGANDYQWLDEYAITPEHTKKGLDWLNKITYKPSHYAKHNWDLDCCVRSNCPLGYREIEILEHFSHFTFTGFYDSATYTANEMGYHGYLPIWRVYAKDGDSFEYYVASGEINIIG